MIYEEVWPPAGGASVPSNQRDGEVSSVGTVWTPDVKLAVVPDQDAPGPEQDGPVAVGNHQLSCGTRR